MPVTAPRHGSFAQLLIAGSLFWVYSLPQKQQSAFADPSVATEADPSVRCCWLVGRHLLLCRRFLRLVLCLVFILPGLLFSLVHFCFEIILRHFRTEVAKGVM